MGPHIPIVLTFVCVSSSLVEMDQAYHPGYHGGYPGDMPDVMDGEGMGMPEDYQGSMGYDNRPPYSDNY